MTKESPLVSVVVNNYNQEKYLAECLDALINQSYKNIEIVAVDAFSNDRSREILQEYSELDSRIKLVFSDTYLKYPADSYNLGFKSCLGNFIAINDPDDISMPDRVEKQLAYLNSKPQIGAVGSNCIEFNEIEEKIIITSVEENIKYARPPVRNPTLMFRASIMREYGMWKWQCEYAADFEWLYRWYTNGVSFFILDQTLVKYRKTHGGNISTTKVVNQSIKLAIFRTYFGVKLFKSVGWKWWSVTLFSYYYVCSRIFWFCINKFKVIFK